jgi:hypothetical protein
MAINYELLNKGGISLGTNFELLSEKPLDSRLVVPALTGLQNYIDNAAAYEGMIVYDQTTKKTYQVQTIDGVLSYREFGINEAEIKALIASETTAAMEFKGATATLPENPAKGDMYKVAGENISIKIDDVDAKLGDSIVYDGEKWFIIPSGDDIEDTWRPVTGVDNDATLTFADGDKTVAAVAADGTVKFNHATVAAPEDITADGDEKTRTYITAVETDGYGHITGYKTATENVEDTNTEYIFESQVESSSVYFNVTPNTENATEQTVYVDAYSKSEANAELDKKVDKVEGKSLIADTEIARLADVHNYDDTQVKADIAKKADAETMTTELGKKVDKVEGKSLIADTEIARLADVYNYNDTEVRGLIGDNAKSIEDLEGYVGTFTHATAKTIVDYIDAKTTGIATSGNLEALAGRVTTAEGDIEALKEASAKHVEKEDGKSLIADTEIARLAAMSDGANKVEKSDTNGNIKIDGAEVVVYTHPEKHAIADVDGLQAALDGKQAAGDYADEAHTHVKADIIDFEHTHVAADITDLDATIKAYDYATKSEAQGYANAKDDAIAAAKKAGDDAQKTIDDYKTENDKALAAVKTTADAAAVKTDVDGALALKADKSVVEAMYTNDAIDTAVQGAKDYAKGLVDAIPAQTDYTVKITETTDGLANDIAKKYTFTQNGAEIGTINLAKELVVTAGSVKEATEADVPYTGAKVGDKYIELVIANQDAPIYVPAKDLVDIYIAKDGAAEVQVANSNTNEISATLVNGGVTEEKLAEGVKTKLNKVWEEVGVAQGLVNDLANGQVKANQEAIEAINNAETGILKKAKDYADGLADNYADADHDHVVADITDFESAVATKVESYGYATTSYADQAEADAKAHADAEVAKDRTRLDKLEAIDHEAYKAADTTLKGEIIGTADDASTADTINGAKKYADEKAEAAKNAAIADAAGKYEVAGTAQGIVDGLKLSETYEPIGAEGRAIAAAKTETENQIKALAGEGNTATVKGNADAIAILIEQFKWGEF